jgi:hypothetical protein
MHDLAQLMVIARASSSSSPSPVPLPAAFADQYQPPKLRFRPPPISGRVQLTLILSDLSHYCYTLCQSPFWCCQPNEIGRRHPPPPTTTTTMSGSVGTGTSTSTRAVSPVDHTHHFQTELQPGTTYRPYVMLSYDAYRATTQFCVPVLICIVVVQLMFFVHHPTKDLLGLFKCHPLLLVPLALSHPPFFFDVGTFFFFLRIRIYIHRDSGYGTTKKQTPKVLVSTS